MLGPVHGFGCEKAITFAELLALKQMADFLETIGVFGHHDLPRCRNIQSMRDSSSKSVWPVLRCAQSFFGDLVK